MDELIYLLAMFGVSFGVGFVYLGYEIITRNWRKKK
jgi:hypothetical protein